ALLGWHISPEPPTRFRRTRVAFGSERIEIGLVAPSLGPTIQLPSGAVREKVTVTARKLIDGAAYGPEALKALGQAFDEAWASIAGNFGDEPYEIERARLKLADALLSVASDESRDVDALKKAALQ